MDTAETLPQIEVRDGTTVKLIELVRHADPKCKQCYGRGTYMMLQRGSELSQRQVCGCCVSRYKKTLRAAAPVEAEDVVTSAAPAVPPRNLEKAKLRIERLTKDAAALEAELKLREKGLHDRIEGMQEELRQKREALKEQVIHENHFKGENLEIGKRIANLRGGIEQLRLETENRINSMLGTIAHYEVEMGLAEATTRQHRAKAELVSAEITEIENRISANREAFKRNTSRLRKDIDKARRRLGIARGYNPEVA